jgi:hypothetical protein
LTDSISYIKITAEENSRVLNPQKEEFMTVRLIQGFFWQHREWIETGMDQMGDVAAMVASGRCRFMFAGTIFPASGNVLDTLVGDMTDDFGRSTLSEVILMPREVTFVKKYDDRPAVINYRFVRDGGIWIGEFAGGEVRLGKARCVITEVPDIFFRPSWEREGL